MANELIIDRASKRLVTDLLTRSSATIPAQFEGDTNVVFDIWSDADWAPTGLTLAIGIPDISPPEDRPSAGYFVLGGATQSSVIGTLTPGQRWQIVHYATGDNFSNIGGGNADGHIFTATGTGTPTNWTHGSTVRRVSSNLPYNATAAQIKAAIESVQTATTVTVTGDDGGPWIAVGADSSDIPLAVASEQNLYPASTVSLIKEQAGDDFTAATIFRISLRRDLIAQASDPDAIGGTRLSVDEIVEGSPTLSAVWDVAMDGMPYGGTLNIGVAIGSSDPSVSVRFNADEASMQSALESLTTVGEGNVLVELVESGPIRFRWRLTFDPSLSDVEVSADDSGIIYGVGQRFTLQLDESGMHEAMAGRDSRAFRMELQDTDTGPTPDTITTLFREPITINNDLISP